MQNANGTKKPLETKGFFGGKGALRIMRATLLFYV
jgi:hypothetical protein